MIKTNTAGEIVIPACDSINWSHPPINVPKPEETMREAFLKAGWAYLNSIADGQVCSDRTCLRCRLADVLYEITDEIADGKWKKRSRRVHDPSVLPVD